MRRLLPLAGVIVALVAGAHTASALSPGLNVTGYLIGQPPPVKNDATYSVCGTDVVPFINVVYESTPIPGCRTDRFMAHYTGYLTLPEHQTVRLYLAADDGGTMKIGTTEWGSWRDKGCTAEITGYLDLPAGVPIPLNGWFYENGGATCFMLAWQLDNGPWQIIDPVYFSTDATMPSTTTSIDATSTSSPTSTEPSTSTTSTTTTSTIAPTTSTTIPPEAAQSLPEPTNQGTTTTQTPQTTSSVTVPPTVQPTTSLTNAPSTSSTQNPTTSIDAPIINASTSSSEPLPSEPSTTTTVPEPRYTPAEALSIAEDPAQVAELSADEAAAVFAAIDEGSLTPELGAALVAAVQDAPAAVRAAFEDKINVFGGATDNYVPLGSRVPVSTRRVIIITTGLLVAMPIRRKASP